MKKLITLSAMLVIFAANYSFAEVYFKSYEKFSKTEVPLDSIKIFGENSTDTLTYYTNVAEYEELITSVDTKKYGNEVRVLSNSKLLTIKIDSQADFVENIKIFNYRGEEVFADSRRAYQDGSTIYLANLSDGVYLVNYEFENQVHSAKISLSNEFIGASQSSFRPKLNPNIFEFDYRIYQVIAYSNGYPNVVLQTQIQNNQTLFLNFSKNYTSLEFEYSLKLVSCEILYTSAMDGPNGYYDSKTLTKQIYHSISSEKSGAYPFIDYGFLSDDNYRTLQIDFNDSTKIVSIDYNGSFLENVISHRIGYAEYTMSGDTLIIDKTGNLSVTELYDDRRTVEHSEYDGRYYMGYTSNVLTKHKSSANDQLQLKIIFKP